MKSVVKKTRSEQRKKRITRTLLWAGVYVFIVILFGFGILYAPPFFMNDIVVSGTERVDSIKVEYITSDIIIKNRALVIPLRNYFTIPKEEIRTHILEALPLVSAVRVVPSLKRILSVEIDERKRWGVYCVGGEIESCYYIDKSGVIFERAPSFRGNLIARIREMRAVNHALGDAVVSVEEMEMFKFYRGALQDNFNIHVEEFLVGREYDDRVEIYTDEGWYLIVDFGSDSVRTFDNIQLVLDEELMERHELEYVDARFEHKVFYKFRE